MQHLADAFSCFRVKGFLAALHTHGRRDMLNQNIMSFGEEHVIYGFTTELAATAYFT